MQSVGRKGHFCPAWQIVWGDHVNVKWTLLSILLVILLFGNLVEATPAQDWIRVPQGAVSKTVDIKDGMVEVGSSLRIPVEVASAGFYQVMLAYRPLVHGTLTNTVLVRVGNEEMRSQLPVLWEDVPGDPSYDKYGNQIPPDQRLSSGATNAFLESSTEYARQPYPFSLAVGTNVFELTPQNYPVCFTSLTLIRSIPDQSYRDYSSEDAEKQLGSDFIVIEGEDYLVKNDSFIRGTNVRNTAVKPNDPYLRPINVLTGISFKNAGQKVLYEFEVTTAGRYTIAFTYSQPLKPGMPVFRTIELDGSPLFSECRDVPFPHTGMNVYDHHLFGGEEPYYVFLEAGRHTLAVKVTAEPIDQIYVDLNRIIGEINATTLQLKKLTGQSSDVARNMDTNRTWQVLQYMPTILEDLSVWQLELHGMYDTLREISGMEPTFANDLLLAAQNLERLQADPRTLPNKIALLGDDASSAAQLLGGLLPKLADQGMSLDRIYIYDGKGELPSPKESMWARLEVGVRQFFHSFSAEMNESPRRGKDGTLTVWVNKPTQYVEVLQDLCAKDFIAQTGIDVAFSIMPREDKLVLANASRTNPDVVVGLSAHYPFDFAVRGVAKNLLEYDDFLQWYGQEYNLESLVPFSFDGGIYAACDTQEFRVLFYRKDILEMLGLEVPQTLDDVRGMMPTLHRNAMNFSIPLSSNREGYKGFQQTMPFVYQNGGDIYAEDGLSATLTDPSTMRGFKEMVDLYLIYGFQTNVRSFLNSFRSGVIPLGISDYGTYLLLQTTAPELADLWDIALAPGVRNETGQVLRYQSAVDTATMIMSSTYLGDEAYEFVKWWLSAETQINYANELQLKYGPDFKWNTANLVAFEEMGLPERHKQTILTMWKDWQKETPRHLASYMLEREISNLWGSAVRDNMPLMLAVDGAQKTVNREMQRKLQEFGFVDENGNVLRTYTIYTAQSIRDLLAEGRRE